MLFSPPRLTSQYCFTSLNKGGAAKGKKERSGGTDKYFSAVRSWEPDLSCLAVSQPFHCHGCCARNHVRGDQSGLAARPVFRYRTDPRHGSRTTHVVRSKHLNTIHFFLLAISIDLAPCATSSSLLLLALCFDAPLSQPNDGKTAVIYHTKGST